MASRMKVALLLLATGVVAAGLAGGAIGLRAKGAGHRASLEGLSVQTPAVSRNATLEDLAQKLTSRFVDPDVGLKYAAMLRANAAAGKYAAIRDDAAFARAVTDDLQAVAFDGHLRVSPSAGHAATMPSPRGPISEIEAAARLTKDVAYIRLRSFSGRTDAIHGIRKFLTDNRDAKTLIFDVRTHGGGGLAEMDVIFPMIFDKPQVLVTMDTRRGVGGSFGDGPTLRRVAAPDTVVRCEHVVTPAAAVGSLQKAKIYVLSSGRTASAGEHFVLSMRRTGRATVIGETTCGAGHFGGPVPIAGGFSAWIPVGRTFDPDTNKGWDYVGVAPNVPVPAAEALTEALVRSGVERREAERLSAEHGLAAAAVRSLRRAPASVPGI